MPDPPRPNPRGRPRIDPSDSTVTVSLALPGRTYDVIYRKAQSERLSVPEIIRRAIRRRTAGDGDPRP